MGANVEADDCRALKGPNWRSLYRADSGERPDHREVGSSGRSRSAAAQHATCVELPEFGEDELLAENRLQNAAKALARRAAR